MTLTAAAGRQPDLGPPDPAAGAGSAKIVLAGGFGAGKTTFVRSVSEITPVTSEAELSESELDDLARSPAGRSSPGKRTTTVALDFGSVALDADLRLQLFGTPGQHRFWFRWDDLASGAIGAVVLVDARRLADCLPAVHFLRARGLPHVVAVNRFDTPPDLDVGTDLDASTDHDAGPGHDAGTEHDPGAALRHDVDSVLQHEVGTAMQHEVGTAMQHEVGSAMQNDAAPERHDVEQVRAAIGLDPDVPLVECDARDRDSAKQTLVTLVAHAMFCRLEADQRP